MNRDARTAQRAEQRGERGQDLVEFALILPLLLLLLFGIIELGRVFFTYNTLANAAREGARFGIVRPGASGGTGSCASPPADTIRGAACRLTSGLIGADVVVTPQVGAETVTVTVDYDVRLVVGPVIAALGGNDTISLRAQSTMRREQ